jgi:hypothetical protein
MSTTNAATLLGLAYPAALELASQIDGTANADKLTQVGIPYPLAVELAAQMTAGTGQVHLLTRLGMPQQLANIVKAAIDA